MGPDQNPRMATPTETLVEFGEALVTADDLHRPMASAKAQEPQPARTPRGKKTRRWKPAKPRPEATR